MTASPEYLNTCARSLATSLFEAKDLSPAEMLEVLALVTLAIIDVNQEIASAFSYSVQIENERGFFVVTQHIVRVRK